VEKFTRHRRRCGIPSRDSTGGRHAFGDGRWPRASLTWSRIAAGLATAAACAALSLGCTASTKSGGPRATSPGDDLKAHIESLPEKEQIHYLQDLRAERPGDAKVSYYLGNAYLKLEQPDSAIVWYEDAVALDSAYAKAHVNLGIALEDTRRPEEAKSHYERALEIDSTDVLARCHLGHYYQVQGDIAEAIRCYVRALEFNPESAQAHYNLGLAFADTRLFAEAIREWERAAALSPGSELGRTAAENVKLIKTYLGDSKAAGGDAGESAR
jgi:tetratricopeptide (TPR) repeat protein